jgi:hypothetical protein
VAVFVAAADTTDLRQRSQALSRLEQLDSARFVDLLLETLDHLPKTPLEGYSTCPERLIISLAPETEDPRVWKKLEEVAKRSDVGMRMECLEAVRPTRGAPPGTRQRRIHLLMAFLDDRAVRDIQSDSSMYKGDYAGAEFPRLEVRDFAAMRCAAELGIPVQPKPTWTGKEWGEFRARVNAALKNGSKR